MPVARLNGTSLYYEIRGSGIPIIFIHGHGLSHTMFKSQMEYFSPYYKVILCDLRGNGRSGELSQSPGEILETQSLDVIMLMNSLNLMDAVFVGISYGGLLVQHIARQYPQRVRAMVVADSFCRNEATSIVGKVQLAAAYCSWLAYYAPCELLLPSLRLLYRRWGMAYAEIRKCMKERRPRELYRQRLAMFHLDYSGFLRSFERPALCIAGDFTEYGVLCMKELAAQLPQGQLVVIPDSSDPSNLCQPDRFNHLLWQFLQTQNLKQRTG